MDQTIVLKVTLNARKIERRVPPRMSLADFIRHDIGLTGCKVGCETGHCGTCTVRLNGEPVLACLMLAVQADGASVETIEGLTASGEIADLQQAFYERNAVQCGFCTAGMLIAAQDLLRRRPDCSRADIRSHLSGNLCRCTGYQSIVDAVAACAAQRRGEDGSVQ